MELRKKQASFINKDNLALAFKTTLPYAKVVLILTGIHKIVSNFPSK
jgi:hypothetical protein